MAINLTHQTLASLAARFWSRLRSEWQSGNKIECGRLVHWLYNRIAGGDITSAQARVSFNAAYGRSLTASDWTSFVNTRLLPMRDRYQAMLDEVDL